MRERILLKAGLSLWCVFIAATFASEPDEWPHVKDLKQCPKCKASFDAAPHPLDYKQCPKCAAALEKAQAYVKKNFKPSMFGLLLDSFYGGFSFLMDVNGDHQKELALCAKNCRDMIKPAPDGNFASPTQIGESWCSWKKSMAMYFLSEYSLRYGLTPENKAALIDGAKFATESQQKGGGWFHSAPVDKQYSPDIAIIGCIYYAAFLEMKALGIDPGPIVDQTRTYLEGISDGKTIGYCKGWHGGMGGGGHSGFVNLGLTGSGTAEDKWGNGLANWLKQNYMDAGHGHANGELHYFAMGAALHRFGPEYYAKFATCQIHRLIEIQHEDGSIPPLSHDDSDEAAFYQKLKNDPNTKGEFPATAVFVCLVLMERPGAFSPLPPKPAGALANKDAFKIGNEALEKYEYAKAMKAFAMVLPGGEGGELIPQAREQMRKIEAVAKKSLETLQAKDAEVKKRFEGKENKEELITLAEMIKDYEKFQKDFEGTATAKEAKSLCEPIQKTLSAKRMKLAFTTGAPANASSASTASPASSAKLKSAETQKEWDDKLKARTKAATAAGAKPRFVFKKLATRVTIISLNNDTLKTQLETGGQMDISWSQLSTADLRTLALDLAAAPATPEDHALAAFYLLCNSDSAKADEELLKAGSEAAKVREAFQVQ